MRDLVLIALFTVAVLLLPLFVTSGFLLNLVVMTLYLALLGQAWNILAASAASSPSATRCSSAPAPTPWRSCR